MHFISDVVLLLKDISLLYYVRRTKYIQTGTLTEPRTVIKDEVCSHLRLALGTSTPLVNLLSM